VALAVAVLTGILDVTYQQHRRSIVVTMHTGATATGDNCCNKEQETCQPDNTQGRQEGKGGVARWVENDSDGTTPATWAD